MKSDKFITYYFLLKTEKSIFTLDKWEKDVLIMKYIMFNMILHLIIGMSLENICIVLHNVQSNFMHSMSFTSHKTICGK